MDGSLIKEGDSYSIKRIIAFVGFVIMSGVFCCQAYKGTVTAEAMVTYPLGVTILYAPQLSVTLLSLWKGIKPS